jgi:hypothetical protein
LGKPWQAGQSNFFSAISHMPGSKRSTARQQNPFQQISIHPGALDLSACVV